MRKLFFALDSGSESEGGWLFGFNKAPYHAQFLPTFEADASPSL